MINHILIRIDYMRSVLYDDRTKFLVLFNFVRGGRCDSTDRVYSNNNFNNGIFHGKSAAQNFKSSETWLNLFKIMKKTQKPIFSAIYANVEKSLYLKISKFWLFWVNGNFQDFFWLRIWNILYSTLIGKKFAFFL